LPRCSSRVIEAATFQSRKMDARAKRARPVFAGQIAKHFARNGEDSEP
jgi:hypothetical protein